MTVERSFLSAEREEDMFCGETLQILQLSLLIFYLFLISYWKIYNQRVHLLHVYENGDIDMGLLQETVIKTDF